MDTRGISRGRGAAEMLRPRHAGAERARLDGGARAPNEPRHLAGARDLARPPGPRLGLCRVGNVRRLDRSPAAAPAGGRAGAMKYLIVNADDFGATPGITRGILEAYHHGVVTSTSFMVTTPWSEEAAALAADELTLSIGLHVDLTSGARDTLVDLADTHECLAELEHQIK